MNETEPLLRVKRIQVDSLFEAFNHRVDLKLDDRVTILHGPNGVGKTMLLKMVNALLDGRYSLFQRVPFGRFVLELTDHRRIELTLGPPKPAGKTRKSSRKARQEPFRTLQLKLFERDKQVDQHEVLTNQDVVVIADAIGSRIPWLHRQSDDLWLDERESDDLLSPEEVVVRQCH